MVIKFCKHGALRLTTSLQSNLCERQHLSCINILSDQRLDADIDCKATSKPCVNL